MGLLAIVDTYLVYKIAEYRYNKTVAFIAAILFAVMPITWILRKILLDPILLPFLLLSILFALIKIIIAYNSNPKVLTEIFGEVK
jgi:4-amino-4-deoxy-L-arabinose transferase-like glycosyltransferase